MMVNRFDVHISDKLTVYISNCRICMGCLWEHSAVCIGLLVCLYLQNYTKAMRLFVGEPVWKAYNRPADDFEKRQQYVASLQCS